MVAGLVAGAIAAPIIGGLLQYQASKEAQAATAAERARIQDLINKVSDPQFDMSQFTPEEYQIVGKYAPQAIPAIQEAAPQLVKQSAAGLQGQDATLSALQQLMNTGRTGTDSQSQALIAQAQRQAQIQNQGQQESILDSLARRGGGVGSGLGFAQALSSQQGANQAASTSGTNAALAAYENRLNALKSAGSLGSQIQQNDMNLQGKNTDIINAFNQRMASMQNQNALANTNNINEAQRLNLGAAQNTADQNVALRNNAVAQKNQLAQQQYNNAMGKIGLQTGNMNASIQDKQSNTMNNNNAIQGAASGVSSGLLYANGANSNPSPTISTYSDLDEQNKLKGYA